MSNTYTNFFELFGLEPSYHLDVAKLSQRHKDLLLATHPDRFANSTESEQLAAVRLAADANQGFAVLKDAYLRAIYLLQLAGTDPLAENATNVMPMEFLEQQMELNEQLEEIENKNDTAQASQLAKQLSQEIDEQLDQLGPQLENNHEQAIATVRRLRYLINSRDKAQKLS